MQHKEGLMPKKSRKLLIGATSVLSTAAIAATVAIAAPVIVSATNSPSTGTPLVDRDYNEYKGLQGKTLERGYLPPVPEAGKTISADYVFANYGLKSEIDFAIDNTKYLEEPTDPNYSLPFGTTEAQRQEMVSFKSDIDNIWKTGDRNLIDVSHFMDTIDAFNNANHDFYTSFIDSSRVSGLPKGKKRPTRIDLFYVEEGGSDTEYKFRYVDNVDTLNALKGSDNFDLKEDLSDSTNSAKKGDFIAMYPLNVGDSISGYIQGEDQDALAIYLNGQNTFAKDLTKTQVLDSFRRLITMRGEKGSDAYYDIDLDSLVEGDIQIFTKEQGTDTTVDAALDINEAKIVISNHGPDATFELVNLKYADVEANGLTAIPEDEKIYSFISQISDYRTASNLLDILRLIDISKNPSYTTLVGLINDLNMSIIQKDLSGYVTAVNSINSGDFVINTSDLLLDSVAVEGVEIPVRIDTFGYASEFVSGEQGSMFFDTSATDAVAKMRQFIIDEESLDDTVTDEELGFKLYTDVAKVGDNPQGNFVAFYAVPPMDSISDILFNLTTDNFRDFTFDASTTATQAAEMVRNAIINYSSHNAIDTLSLYAAQVTMGQLTNSFITDADLALLQDSDVTVTPDTANNTLTIRVENHGYTKTFVLGA